jgi:hypothetical protein
MMSLYMQRQLIFTGIWSEDSDPIWYGCQQFGVVCCIELCHSAQKHFWFTFKSFDVMAMNIVLFGHV